MKIYTQDIGVYCVFSDNQTNEQKKEKGRLHICSRSLIFESDSLTTPIFKYFFRYFQAPVIKERQTIKLTLSKVVEIVTQGPPSPYKTHDSKGKYELEFQLLSHENIDYCYNWINVLYDISKESNPGFDPDKDLEQIQTARGFQKKFDMSQVSVSEKPIVEKAPLQIRRILPLIFISGLEIFLEGKEESYYFAFSNEIERDQVYKSIRDRMKSENLNHLSYEHSLEQWQKREISNYEYLMRLNHAGNRSSSDLSQYPIFPWVIKDYESSSIDLNDSSIYRDLKLPIGAINDKRLQEFKIRYEEMPMPKFMYGTHYSTPGYVIGYLIRKYPQYMLKLQSGRFDKPDRLFKSIKGDWKNVMYNNASVKELIPEFYQEDPSFLLNSQNLNLGVRQNEKKVDDVKVPRWAMNQKHFLQINREALESEYVSNNLHHWIDLIFGYKQRGPQSVEANNVFHPLTYEGAVDFDKITDPLERQAKRCQINEFGQCPKQLFKIPHPPRRVSKFSVNQPKLESCSSSEESKDNNNNQGNCNKGEKNKQLGNNTSNNSLWDDNNIQYSVIQKANKQNINQVIQLQKDKNKIICIGKDGSLKVIDLAQMQITKSFKLCQQILSCICPIVNDELFAIGSWDSKIYVFNLNYGSTVEEIEGHSDTVSSLLHMKKRQKLFTGSWDCTIKMFDINEVGIDDNSTDFIDHTNSITAMATNSQEDILAYGDVEGTVCVYNIDDEEQIFSLNLQDQKIVKLLIKENNLVILGDQHLRFYEVAGTQISSFAIEPYNGQYTDVIIDGKFLIAVTNKGHMPIYDLLQEKKIRYYYKNYQSSSDDIVEDDQQFTTLFINQDSTVAIVGSQNGSLSIIQKKVESE